MAASCSNEAFGEILNPRLDRGEVIIDPARFVADPDKAQRFPELPYVTLRLAYMACEYFNADLGLAIVRAEHQAFYRRVFLHETIAEPRFFPGLLKPVGLMAADFPAMRDKVFERYPMMRSTAFERRMLFERGGEHQSWRRRMSSPFERTSIVPQSCRAGSRNHRPGIADPAVCRGSGPIGPPTCALLCRSPRKAGDCGSCRLPSPSRHIYKSLTITVAFRRFAGI